MSLLPAPRLLWSVFGLALIACVAGPLPVLLPFWWAGLGGIFLTAVIDAVISLWRLDPLVIAAPSVVRLHKDRPGVIPVVFTNPGANARRLRFTLGLPAHFHAPLEATAVDLPADAKQARIEWACTPRQRGRTPEILAGVEALSKWGWWLVRTRTVLACELRVYPNLFSERKQLAALFLARGSQGAMVRRMVGRGREFEKLRDYLPGDGYDEVHWKATAKRGRPITKVFQAERTQEIYVVIDSSRLSARRVTHEGMIQTALERVLVAALVLMLAAERQGDRFGLVVYDERVRLFLRANRGAAHYAACREAVLALQPSECTPDVAEIVRHLKSNLRKRSLLFFLTDLTDPVLAEDFVKHVRLLAQQHLVLVSQMRAAEVAPLFAGANVASEPDVYARLAGHTRWSENRALAQRLKPLGVTAALLENGTFASQLVAQYLQVKRRQQL